MFDDAAPEALVAAVGRAARAAHREDGWAALRDRGMAVDFNWDTGPAPRTWRRTAGDRASREDG